MWDFVTYLNAQIKFYYLVVALMWHRLEYYGLHSRDVGEFYLRYVKGTNYMGPACKYMQRTNQLPHT